MTDKTYIGIDVGRSGGIAWSDRTGVHCEPMPESRADTIHLLAGILDAAVGIPVAYVEKVAEFLPEAGGSKEGSGGTRQIIYGKMIERPSAILEAIAIVKNIPLRIIEIRPQEWQAVYHFGKVGRIRASKDMDATQRKRVKDANGKAKRDWKAKLKEEAQRRFPTLNITLKTADAALILDAAIQLEAGKLGL